MPKIGQKYQHKQIKDVVYIVAAVNTEQRYVFLKENRSKPFQVTFTNLDKSYRRL